MSSSDLWIVCDDGLDAVVVDTRFVTSTQVQHIISVHTMTHVATIMAEQVMMGSLHCSVVMMLRTRAQTRVTVGNETCFASNIYFDKGCKQRCAILSYHSFTHSFNMYNLSSLHREHVTLEFTQEMNGLKYEEIVLELDIGFHSATIFVLFFRMDEYSAPAGVPRHSLQ